MFAAEAFYRPGSRSGTAFDQPPSNVQMRLGTAIGPSPGQMRLGTAVAPSYTHMRLGTAVMPSSGQMRTALVPSTARLGTGATGDGAARPMTSTKVRR